MASATRKRGILRKKFRWLRKIDRRFRHFEWERRKRVRMLRHYQKAALRRKRYAEDKRLAEVKKQERARKKEKRRNRVKSRRETAKLNRTLRRGRIR